jgi:hypothetical protein
MSESGYPGSNLSLGVWSNVMRFIPGAGIAVNDLAAKSLAPPNRVKFQLGCVERWQFVVLQPDSPDHRPGRARRGLRDGWGSGRGIRGEWIVRATEKGRKAVEVWPPLFDLIEKRWVARFGGNTIAALRKFLAEIVDQLDVELPLALPSDWEGRGNFPPRTTRDAASLSIPALLSQLLTEFTLEFHRESRVALELCANTLRVLGEKPIPAGEIPALTGGSPEKTDIGWRLKPFVIVERNRKDRGKVLRLSALGILVQANYHRLLREIEERWEKRFGANQIHELRESLRTLLTQREGGRLLISEGLLAPEGVVRSGKQVPALGREAVAAAARQRSRDLVQQTQLFIQDPAHTLPHYPLWDMNRGFGP